MKARAYTGRIVDAHVHLENEAELAAAKLSDHGIMGVVNYWDLSWPPPDFPQWEERWSGGASPDMALLHMPDLDAIRTPDFDRTILTAVRRAHDRGAVGIKVWKNLGLTLLDARGGRVPVDDRRLEVLWDAAAEVELPVAIHVGDPPGFFEPVEPSNERYLELQLRPDYWFGDRARFPTLERIHDEFETLVMSHPETVFLGLHFGCFMPIARVHRMLREYPQYHVDTATRTSDLGREPYRTDALKLFRDFPERVVFGTDLIRTGTYDLPARSSKPGAGIGEFYAHHRDIFETDRDDLAPPFAFLPPWRLQGLRLDETQLKALYLGNATRLFARAEDNGRAAPRG